MPQRHNQFNGFNFYLPKEQIDTGACVGRVLVLRWINTVRGPELDRGCRAPVFLNPYFLLSHEILKYFKTFHLCRPHNFFLFFFFLKGGLLYMDPLHRGHICT